MTCGFEWAAAGASWGTWLCFDWCGIVFSQENKAMVVHVCKQGPFEKEQLSTSLVSIMKMRAQGAGWVPADSLDSLPSFKLSLASVGCLYTHLNSSVAWSGHLNVMIAERFKRYFCYIAILRGTDLKLFVKLVVPGGKKIYFSGPFWEARFKTSDSGNKLLQIHHKLEWGRHHLRYDFSPWLTTLVPRV